MAGSANSIQTHNVLRGRLSEDNVIAGTVGTGYNPTYALVGEAAAQIVLYINSSDYKMYAELKDKNGNHIMNSNIIDLPLETMVVNGSYDSETREVVLILDNGNELRFSVADLVRGLVSEEDLTTTLGDYVKFTDYATGNNSGIIKVDANNYGINTNAQGKLYVGEANYQQYETKGVNYFIGKGTLENVITGKQLVNKTYVDEADEVFEEDLFGDASIIDSGENVTLENTIEKGLLRINLKGNTSQEVIQGEVGLEEEDTSIYVDDVDTDKENYITLKGNTYQETTSVSDGDQYDSPSPDYPQEIEVVTGLNEVKVEGKNLLPNEITTQTTSGITITKNEDGSLTINGSTTAGVRLNFASSLTLQAGTYMVSTKETSSSQGYFSFYEGSTEIFVMSFKSQANKRFTLNEETTIRPTIYISNNGTFNNYTIYPMLEKGSTATEYEPYKGQTYEVNLDYTNLFKKQDISSNDLNRRLTPIGVNYNDTGYFVSPYISIKPNTQYIINYTPDAYTRICYYSSNNTSSFISKNDDTATFTTPNNATYLRFCNLMADIDNIRLEKGSTITNNYIELCKIGTYQDRIYKNNGNWYLHKEIYKEVLNGTQNWIYQSQFPRFISNLSKTPVNSYTSYCSHYFQGQTANVNNSFNVGSGTGYKQVLIHDERFTTGEQFNTWLSNNNVNLYYALTEPTDTQITDTTLVNQLEALYTANIHSITHINTETSNLLPYIDLKYNVVTASPSPDRASEVEVVKGNNTITISNENGTKTQTFNLTLGNLELCKIGDYQDYFYKENGNWYKYGAIGKVVLNGSESGWHTSSLSVTGYKSYYVDSSIRINQDATGSKCNYFEYKTFNEWQSLLQATFIENSYQAIGIRVVETLAPTLEDFKIWLSTHNTIAYFVLATPTTTQITDQLLVSQLDELQKAMSYYDKTIITQTNADKPFILDVTTFKNTTKGKIEVIEEKNQSFENKDNKVIIINSSSTDTEYPSAKCVYNLIGNIESILETLDIGNGV